MPHTHHRTHGEHQTAEEKRAAAQRRTDEKAVKAAQREAILNRTPLRLLPDASHPNRLRAVDGEMRTVAIGELVLIPRLLTRDQDHLGIGVGGDFDGGELRFRSTQKVFHI